MDLTLPGVSLEARWILECAANPPPASREPPAPPPWGFHLKNPKPQPELGHPWPRGCLSISGFLGMQSNSVPLGGPGERASQMNSMQTCDD